MNQLHLRVCVRAVDSLGNSITGVHYQDELSTSRVYNTSDSTADTVQLPPEEEGDGIEVAWGQLLSPS